MVTPLAADESVDVPSLRRLVDFLIGAGVHGLWAMGTTGEFAALPEAERARGVEATVEQADGRVPVIANIGGSSTGLALRHARHAVDAGADALAATPPHYYTNTMDELLVHYRTLKQAFPDQPLLIYNIPQNVKVKMTVPTTLQLIGAHGAIPATSNVAPAAAAEAWEAAVRGDFDLARRAQEVVMRFEELAEIARGGSAEAAGFASMKTVLHEWGIIDDARLTRPLRCLSEEETVEVRRRLLDLPHGAQRLAVVA
jgi:4-hydroxy-tetrahydrodipicolinate synthase